MADSNYLLEWLKCASQHSAADALPEIDTCSLTEQEQTIASLVLELINQRQQIYQADRERRMMLLSDTDALGETLVRIGMGDFSKPIADVQLEGLKPIRIGIEDMQLQLEKSQASLHQLIHEVRDSEEKFRQLVETTSDWIWELDRDDRYSYSSPQVSAILGYQPQELLGRKPQELMPRKEAKQFARELKHIKKTAAPIIQLRHTTLHKDGRKLVLESNAVPFFNERGKIAGYRGVDRDITSRSLMEEKLRYMASHDALTGLFNRQVFNDRVEYEISRANRYVHSLSAFLLDIDFFKRVNDSYGHSAGDDVLKGFAELLMSSLRGTDFIARIGGEEFTVLLPETDLGMAMKRAELLRKAIEEHTFHLSDGRSLQMTSSIGVAAYPDNASDAEGLLRAADGAMYEAKRSGRNRVLAAS